MGVYVFKQSILYFGRVVQLLSDRLYINMTPFRYIHTLRFGFFQNTVMLRLSNRKCKTLLSLLNDQVFVNNVEVSGKPLLTLSTDYESPCHLLLIFAVRDITSLICEVMTYSLTRFLKHNSFDVLNWLHYLWAKVVGPYFLLSFLSESHYKTHQTSVQIFQDLVLLFYHHNTHTQSLVINMGFKMKTMFSEIKNK